MLEFMDTSHFCKVNIVIIDQKSKGAVGQFVNNYTNDYTTSVWTGSGTQGSSTHCTIDFLQPHFKLF